MKDILGREIKPGDPVVCMAVGRNSSGMHFGIETENGSVKTLRGIKSSYNRFLVTNPSDDELELMEKIKKKYKDEEIGRQKALEERRAKKAIPYNKLQFCHVYEDDKGDEYVFLGMCKVCIQVKQEYGRLKKDINLEGYTYIPVKYYLNYFTNEDHEHGMIYLQSHNPLHIRKSRKRLVKDKGLCESLMPYVDGKVVSRIGKGIREYSYVRCTNRVDISYRIERVD